MRRPLVAGNWKQNGSRVANAALLGSVRAGAATPTAVDVMVCPPAVYLAEARAALAGSPVLLGAQNLSAETSGAFTGEVGGAMLADIGCTHVIVGHSERRTLYGETDAVVARKFAAARAAGLVPILCVGESLVEREAGTTLGVIGRQLRTVIEHVGIAGLGGSIVAYEPVWAIGTGRNASPEQAEAVHREIRAVIAARDATMAGALRILYGGSVKARNAAELFAMPDIDGGLIGGASLDATEFAAICRAAAG